MPKSKNISNKVTDAWALQDYYISINDQEICDIDIVDFEAVYGGCEVKALVKFIDSKGILTGDKQKAGIKASAGFVKVGWVNCTGCSFEGEFFITGIRTTNNEKNQKLIQLDLVDKETRNLKGTFKDKFHKDKKISDVIKETYSENKTEKDIIIAANDVEEKLNIQIPGNIDFHSFIGKFCDKFNYKFIKDKMNTYLVHGSKLEFDKLSTSQNTYIYDTNQYAMNRIVQFEMDGFDMEAYLSSMPTTTNTTSSLHAQGEKSRKEGTDTNTSKKEDIPVDKNVEKAVKSTRGSKQQTLLSKDKQYFNSINNAQRCSIWVPGMTSNLIGKKVTVVFPKPSYYEGDDEIFTGEWEVFGVRDKIIGFYYMMELFLRRPGGK
jgi:hypothetical protein